MKFRAKKIPHKEISVEEILIRFCYYYQQYKLNEARQLPYKRVIQMLKFAEKERAKFFFELTQIAAAPHTKKGSGIKSLLSRYEDIIKQN